MRPECMLEEILIMILIYKRINTMCNIATLMVNELEFDR